MDLVKLKYFLAVLETGHFARAAQSLGISQPAVSKSIKALEDDLGVRLFERGQFGAEPTRYALRLATRAKLMLAEGRLARAELDAMRGARKGRLAIGAGISFASRILPLAIERYRRRWPGISVSVDVGMSGVLFPALQNGEYDFVVSAPPLALSVDGDLAQEKLFDEVDSIVVGRGHPLIAQRPQSLADVAGYPWLVSGRSGLWDYIRGSYLAAGLPPPTDVVNTDSELLAKGLLNTGPFVCLLGRELYAMEAEAGLLFEIPLAGFGDVRPAFITTRKRSPLQLAARNMIQIVRSVCAADTAR
ncbi:LysR family transcriptional regulator [Glacieibacterium frigidum]|uniref:LysR family transcriptional regulator n=1 Tax=Glacieibacterium frigidum TaxID=2593303 RepID=A0A552U9R4_9SPHN|nr:LysR family transcriptional regulator [Glacieibacterium frigidum]TRW14929.1 LysR family transcriptional regulator [Glacieibacterium frigidum]